MLSLGIDASSSCCGLCLVEDTEMVLTTRWKPRGPLNRPNKEVGLQKVMAYLDWLGQWLSELPQMPDLATVELSSNVRTKGRPNLDTVRWLARFELASMIGCMYAGIETREINVASARSHVFRGAGRLDKGACGERICEMFPAHEFADLNETDAAVLALDPFLD